MRRAKGNPFGWFHSGRSETEESFDPPAERLSATEKWLVHEAPHRVPHGLTEKPVATGLGENEFKVGARATHSAQKISNAIIGKGGESAEGITIGSAIRFDDITIDGELDLSALSVEKPIVFVNCLFPDSFIARNAKFALLQFLNCTFQTINLFQARFANSFVLTDCTVRHGIDLAEAEIDGLLDFNGTRIIGVLNETQRAGFFDGDRAAAINAYNINVSRDVTFDRITAKGVVNLRRAYVGSLDFDGSDLSCGDDKACLDARGLVSEGDVTIGRGFKARGSVNLVAAKIAGKLDFRGGVFSGVGGEEVISCDGMKSGPVYFQEDEYGNTPPAEVRGRVVLSNADIDGRLDMRGVKITLAPDTKEPAVDCNFTKIKGNVRLSAGFSANGAVTFLQAVIDGQFNMDGAKIKSAHTHAAILINSARIEKNVYFRDKFECIGVINGVGAELGGVMSICNCNIDACYSRHAISFGKAQVKRTIEIGEGAVISGAVSFRAARIGFSFKCSNADISRCEGWVNSEEYKERGDDIDRDVVIDLLAVNVGTSIEFEDMNGFDGCIDLRRAKTRIYVDDATCWSRKTGEKPEARFLLDGFTYDYFPQFKNAGMERYQDWLELRVDVDSKRDLSVQPWSHLAKVLKDSGHEVTARRVAIAREVARRKYLLKKRHFVRLAGTVILGLIVGYGYRPVLGVFAALFVIVSGMFIYDRADGEKMITAAQPAIIAKYDADENTPLPAAYGHFQPFIFSLDVFVPFLDLHQESRWLPVEKCVVSEGIRLEGRTWRDWFKTPLKRDCTMFKASRYKYFMSLQTLLGWLIIALTGLAFSGMFKRE